jgi:hypothetical protein
MHAARVFSSRVEGGDLLLFERTLSPTVIDMI